MHTVFISYSQKDQEIAAKVKATLEANDIKVTIDSESMAAGGNIREFIDQAIRDTQVTLSIVSRNSLSSDWVALESVESFAAEKFLEGKNFIACYIDEEMFRDEFLIEAIDALDQQISELAGLIQKCVERNTPATSYETKKNRKLKLRSNLSDILERLNGSLTLDIRESAYETSLQRIIKEIRGDDDSSYRHNQTIKDKTGSAVKPNKGTRSAKPDTTRGGNAVSKVITVPTPVLQTVRLSGGELVRFEMVNLPGGKFEMGSKKGRFLFMSIDDEQPVHSVTLKPFLIGKYPVTQLQWEAVMGSNPSKFKGPNRPVENVSWDEVQSFLRILGNGFRLPSEAEWEYAARGGTNTEYSFGDNKSLLDEYAWFFSKSGSGTHPVGEKKPNPFGLFDMHGNVWEWVEDHWHDNYNGAPTDGSAWVDADTAAFRVVRGGGWFDFAVSCRSAIRAGGGPGNRRDNLGFRLSRTLP